MTDPLLDSLIAPPEGFSEQFEIHDDDAAGWAFRKLAKVEDEIARIRHLAATEIARIEAWAEDAERPLAHDKEFFTARLVAYRRRLEADNPKLPGTYKTPWGNLTRSKGREKAVVTDEAAFTDWALTSAPGLLTVKPALNEIKRLPHPDGQPLADGGEVVPGVVIERGPDNYGVTLPTRTTGEF